MTKISNFDRWAENLHEDLGSLVDSHEEHPDPRRFTRYADDPVAFIEEVLGETDPGPWEAQREIAQTIRDHPLVAVRSCNAAGKDWIAARLALWWTYAHRGLALVTGPTERQVKEVVMGEVARAFSKSGELPGELYQMALRVGRDSQAGILAFTSTEASRLTGFHGPAVLGILTEAQGVEAFAWEGLLSNAVGPDDRLLAVGNPLAPSGKFYSVSRASNWETVQVSAEDHPNVRNGEQVIPGGVSRAFVDRMRQEYGENSSTYRARVHGEFPTSSEDSLLDRTWLEEAARRWDEQTFAEAADEATPLVAVDPARFGTDETVTAVRYGPRIDRLVTWGQADTMETVGRLREEVLGPEGIPTVPEYEQIHGEDAPLEEMPRVVADEVGVGAGVADRLEEAGYNVATYNGGRQAEESARFRNLRSEAYWQLRTSLERGVLTLPNDAELFDQLMAVTWSRTSSGQVKIESKRDLRNRLGRSPDWADAVVMALVGHRLRARYEKLVWISA